MPPEPSQLDGGVAADMDDDVAATWQTMWQLTWMTMWRPHGSHVADDVAATWQMTWQPSGSDVICAIFKLTKFRIRLKLSSFSTHINFTTYIYSPA
jgi:hypothetical protein